MLFNTLPFALFFAIVFGLWTLLAPWPRARWTLLTVSSIAFYAAWDARYLLLLGAIVLFDWAVALALPRAETERRRRVLVTAACVGNLGALGIWKYSDFALDVLRPFAAALDATLPGPLHLVLPLGISFFTFQGLGYVIDVYRRVRPAVARPHELFLALAFFPHLIAGPIVRVWDLLPQLHAPQPLDDTRFSRALLQFLRGLVKKAAADYLGRQLVDRVFDLPSHYAPLEVLAAIYGYALQIYGDFSGYTDMAIGLAALLGIDLPQNFDHPYAARSLREFWRRWHITLSAWLRDYLFISLGGSRDGALRTARNLFVTMLLGGLWHGAAWTFVIWGALHGAFLVIERQLGLESPRAPSGIRSVLATLLTFHLVALAWVFFRAESAASALELLSRLAHGWGGGAANVPLGALAVMACGFALHWAPRSWRAWGEQQLLLAPSTVQAAVALACLYLARDLSAGNVQPFIYFQF